MAADTAALIAGAEQYLASLTDPEFVDLVNRTRPPADPNGTDGAKPAADPTATAGTYPANWNTGGTR